MLLAVLQRTLGVVDDSLGRNLKSALAKLTIDSQLARAAPRVGGGAAPAHARTTREGSGAPAPRRSSGRRWAAGGASSSATTRSIAARPRRARCIPTAWGWPTATGTSSGYDEGRDGLRNFRVDRIRGKVSVIDKEDGAYAVPEDFDAQRYIGAQEFELAEGPEVDVLIELDPTATWLMERRRQGIGTLTLLEGGLSRLEVSVRSEEGLYRWLAEFGQHARIVEPVRMAHAFRERMEATRARYADVAPVS